MTLDPPDGAEPDRAAAYERMLRAILAEPDSEAPTNLDLIVGHPFQGTSRWGDVCEHEAGAWICGYGRAEHANPGADQ